MSEEAWQCSVSASPTRPITDKCDTLAAECDRVLASAISLNTRVAQISTTANYTAVKTVLLSRAQADVERQRTALNRRLFWSKLNPFSRHGILRNRQH